MRAKRLSLALSMATALMFSIFLAMRFYLMIYFPGTEDTRELFNFFIPRWDAFSQVTLILQMPILFLHNAIAPFLPETLSSWFPEMPAAQFFSRFSKTPGAFHVELYPGKVEWLTLIAIPFWWFFLLLLHMSLWTLAEIKEKASELEIPEIKLPEKKAPPPSRHAGIQTSSTYASDDATPTDTAIRKASSVYAKERLSQFKPGTGDLPTVKRYEGRTTQADQEKFKRQEGEMMVREMVRSLQHENRNLQSQQQELRSTFSQYFSPNVLRYLEENKLAFQRIENQKRNVSVMFCDIRGFSAYSQNASPPEIVDYLSEYFNIASYVILQEYDGIINKLMGDGLMAYWGFPIPVQDHAYIATQAALKILKEVELRNLTKPQAHPLEIGIGIASGEAIIGNIGSTDFKDFTLLGVPVNLASRLEEANKQLGTRLLISSNTHRELQGRVSCKDQGEITLRGWQGTERVYAPALISIQGV